MPFEIPDDLHPDCAKLAWLLGTWAGNGHGQYPTIEPFEFGQELVFSQDGRAFFHYMSRAWIVDESGEKIRDAAIESGFLRCRPDDSVELLLSHSTGFVELWYGRVEGARVELATDAVVRTGSAKEYTAGQRLYGLVQGDLYWTFDMAAMGKQLSNHLAARLLRR